MKKLIKKLTVWILVFSFFIDATPVWALTKEETVYSKLNSDGSVSSTSVYEHLYGSDLDSYKDKSSLNNITNINGEEKYNKDENNITWEANGNDIYYNGTTNKDLPISLDIKYYLNNKEYEAKDMLGKKGKVKIVIKYHNKLKHQVIVNNKIETIYTPFVVATTSLLPNDNNKNIKISSGKVINNGNTSLVVGISSPGLYESLDLEELKGMDTLEITYETKSFELSSIYAVATSKLIGEEDLDVLNNIKSLYSGIDALQENMDLIVDGSKQLANGTNEFNNAIKDLGDKYHYYRSLNKDDIINLLKPILNNAIDNSLPSLKDKAKETIDYAKNNISPEMIGAIAKAAANSTKEVLGDEIDKVLDNIDLESYINSIIGEELINEIVNDQEIRTLASDVLNTIGNSYNTTISTITNNALNDLTNSLTITATDAYVQKVMEDLNIDDADYYQTYAIINRVQQDTVNGIKSQIRDNTPTITSSIVNNVINNMTKAENVNNIINNYVTNTNAIIAEIASSQKAQVYKDELKNNIATYLRNELAKKDLIQRYIETSNYMNDVVNEIIDETATQLSESYFTGMTSDMIKQIINDEFNKYSIKDELNKIINDVNSKINVIDEKVDLLTSSVALINDGANQLANGLEMFNNEGIKKLSGFVNGDVRSLTGKIEALAKLSSDYKILDDINSNDNGTSKIIFIIDALKKEEDKKVTTEKIVEKESLWDKIKGLFK